MAQTAGSYRVVFTFIQYGVHKADASVDVRVGKPETITVNDDHGYRIGITLNEAGGELRLLMDFALRGGGQTWTPVSQPAAVIRPGQLRRFDMDIAEAGLRDVKGNLIKRLSFGVRLDPLGA